LACWEHDRVRNSFHVGCTAPVSVIHHAVGIRNVCCVNCNWNLGSLRYGGGSSATIQRF
jgi:hypothetical protein